MVPTDFPYTSIQTYNPIVVTSGVIFIMYYSSSTSTDLLNVWLPLNDIDMYYRDDNSRRMTLVYGSGELSRPALEM